MLSYACLRYLNTLCICYSSSRSLCNLEIHLFDISANISSKGCPPAGNGYGLIPSIWLLLFSGTICQTWAADRVACEGNETPTPTPTAACARSADCSSGAIRYGTFLICSANGTAHCIDWSTNSNSSSLRTQLAAIMESFEKFRLHLASRRFDEAFGLLSREDLAKWYRRIEFYSCMCAVPIQQMVLRFLKLIIIMMM